MTKNNLSQHLRNITSTANTYLGHSLDWTCCDCHLDLIGCDSHMQNRKTALFCQVFSIFILFFCFPITVKSTKSDP